MTEFLPLQTYTIIRGLTEDLGVIVLDLLEPFLVEGVGLSQGGVKLPALVEVGLSSEVLEAVGPLREPDLFLENLHG